MTRIVAGTHGGRRIATPVGSATRPTSDRTREALFASLTATHDLETGPFVDLYAGSGAIGIEALSRGAPTAVFVDSNRSAVVVIRANLDALELTGRARVLGLTASRATGQLADLSAQTVFADPPYDLPAADLREVLSDLAAVGGLASGAAVVVERAVDRRGAEWRWPAPIQAVRDRRYGTTHLWYGRAL